MSLSSEQLTRLRKAQATWEGTRYLPGQQVPKSGVDCVRLCDAILCDMLYLDLPHLPRFAQDSAFHNKAVVQQMTRLLFERFDLFSVPLHSPLSPGDLLVARQRTPANFDAESEGHHVALVTHTPVKVIDAWPGIGVRVMGTGGFLASFQLLKIWRSGYVHNVP